MVKAKARGKSPKKGTVTVRDRKVQYKITKEGKDKGAPYRLYMREGNRKWYGMTDVKLPVSKDHLEQYALEYLDWEWEV